MSDSRSKPPPVALLCWFLVSWLAPATLYAGDGSEYTVYPQPVESPQHTTPAPPADARSTVVEPADTVASPLGWHDTDGVAGAESTLLEGNNVRLFTAETPPLPAVDCGPMLSCDFPLDLSEAPVTYTAASQTNVFYWLNLFHDVTFRHGFDTAAGNFQVNTYGGGGVGGDRLETRLRYDVSCGSTVSIPPDGASGGVIVSPCTVGGTTRDTALDSTAVLHLAAHGLAERLVGGPGNVACLGHVQSPREGWADWLGLLFTIETGDTGTDPRPYATWFIGQPAGGNGVRGLPYSTDPAINDWTYETIFGSADPFAIGAVWAEALWRATWALIDLHGFDPDLANAAGGAGNQRILSYAIEGMKLGPCLPTFLDARDALLAAATTADANDVCPLWNAFAVMGLGTDATSVGPGSTQVTNGFAVPAECSALTSLFTDGFESGGCGGWTSVFPGC
ncbi:MAG: M36 family metallopeptidase [Acidobacteria bacterium]|nr:M36 family metallopeptidase [Acidobacteriota bacterium]